MHHADSKHHRPLPTVLFLGALALAPILVAGCGDSGKPAPAKTESNATPAAETGKNATDAVASNAKKVGEAVADKANQVGYAVTDGAKKGADEARKIAESATNLPGAQKMPFDSVQPTQIDPDTLADKGTVEEKMKMIRAEAEKAQNTQMVNERELKARQAELEGMGVSETDARAKALGELQAKHAATKPGADPMAQDVDPNSKAKLVYEFGSDTKTFGKVMQGDVLNWKFKMQSDGEDDLVIKQAKPTCGCTVANILVEDNGTMVAYQYGKPIPPGRKVEIDATLHTVNKRGHASSKININSNDPRGQTILSLEADVDPFFSVNPPSINFARMSAKDTATDKLTVSTSKGDRIKLSVAKDMLPQGVKIDVNPLDADADGKATRFDVVVTAGPGLVEGNLAYSVRMLSDLAIAGGEKLPNGQQPTYETQASVMAQVTGAISLNQQFISLGLIRPGQSLARTVRVSSHDPSFKITDPKVSIQGRDTVEWEFAKFFTPTVRPVAGENAVDVEVTLTGMPDTLAGSFSGNLVIKTGHPERDEVKVLISGVCRGGTAGGMPTPPAPLPVVTPLPGSTPPK